MNSMNFAGSLALLFALTPQASDVTLPPAPSRTLFAVDAIGVQVYHCGVTAGAFKWNFVKPEADLFDQKTHEPVGTHTAGPTWTWKDGSSITGKVQQQAPSPDPNSIPWLLVATTPTGSTSGVLSNVAFVRRFDTQAGLPTTSLCDADHSDSDVKVPYKAVYTFYSAN